MKKLAFSVLAVLVIGMTSCKKETEIKPSIQAVKVADGGDKKNIGTGD